MVSQEIGWSAVVLAALVSGYAVYTTVNGVLSVHSDDQQIHVNVAPEYGQQNRQYSMSRVINAHLFGVEPKKTVAREVKKVVNAPPTRLNLVLTGIVAGSSPSEGFAMIEVTRGETNLVAVGNEIGKTGATVHEIYQMHILIDHRGKIEKLELERDSIGAAGSGGSGPVTVHELELSAAELAVLTQINKPEESSNAVLQGGAGSGSVFSDENFVQSELRASLSPDKEIVDPLDEDDLEEDEDLDDEDEEEAAK